MTDEPLVARKLVEKGEPIFDQDAMLSVFSEGVMTVMPADDYVKLVFFEERPKAGATVVQRSNLILTMPRARFLATVDVLKGIAETLRGEARDG